MIGERQCQCVACCRYFLAAPSPLFYDKRVPTELRICSSGLGRRVGPLCWGAGVRDRPAYRAVTIQDETSWTFTLAVRSAGLDPVRLVLSFARAALTGIYAVLVTNHRLVCATLANRMVQFW